MLLAAPTAAGELVHVVQHGFRPCSEYCQQGLDGAVRLANCINLADQLRMHAAIEHASASSSSSSSSSGSGGCVLEGQLLVCKVDLGSALQEAEGKVQLAAKAGESSPQPKHVALLQQTTVSYHKNEFCTGGDVTIMAWHIIAQYTVAAAHGVMLHPAQVCTLVWLLQAASFLARMGCCSQLPA
jgi:hypothetical protein